MDSKTAKNVLSKLKPSYSSFFDCSERASSKKNKPVVIVKDIDQFISKVVADTEIEVIDRVFIAVILSGACRASEALSLRRCDLEIDEASGRMFFWVKVLKKRGKTVKRPILIHEAAVALIKEFVMSKRNYDHLFDFTSAAALYRVKKAFAKDFRDAEGLDCHSFRHSFVSFALFHETSPMSIQKVSAVMKLDSRQVMRYAHVDAKKELLALYQEDDAA